MPNILLIGKAGSGKDTVAEILASYGYKPYALADPIREAYKRAYPGQDPKQDRASMIKIGEDTKARHGKDCWVLATLSKIVQDGVEPVIITDGRYGIEYDFFVTKLGYIPVRVCCDDRLRLARLSARDGSAQEDALKKESTELDGVFAYNVYNEKTIDDLKEQIEILIKILNMKD